MPNTPEEKKVQTPAEKPNVSMSIVQKYQQTFMSSVKQSMVDRGFKQPDAEQLACGNYAVIAMNKAATDSGVTLGTFDQSNVNTILQTVMLLRINFAAMPSEGGIEIRNVKNPQTGSYDKKEIRLFVQGAGNDKILRTYGVNVKEVRTPWIIHEGDDFTYPSFDGISISAPKWTPKSYYGKVIRVVYPIIMKDGNVEYAISERESVADNLKAHINNNMFGAGKRDQRDAVLTKIQNLNLESLLSDPTLSEYISPAWRLAQSREAMIERKLRNNATKKFPKDFGDAFIAEAVEDTFDDYDQYKKAGQVSAAEVIDTVTGEIAEKSASEQMPPKPGIAKITEKEPVQVAPAPQTTKPVADDLPY